MRTVGSIARKYFSELPKVPSGKDVDEFHAKKFRMQHQKDLQQKMEQERSDRFRQVRKTARAFQRTDAQSGRIRRGLRDGGGFLPHRAYGKRRAGQRYFVRGSG